MKFDQLRSMAHNMADSLADGNGALIGHFSLDLFEEAAQSPGGFVEIDLLNGKVLHGRPSAALGALVRLYGEHLPAFCSKHGGSIAMLRRFQVRFYGPWRNARFIVTIDDADGKQATDEYVGVPGRRIKTLDPLGRIRKVNGRIVRLTNMQCGAARGATR